MDGLGGCRDGTALGVYVDDHLRHGALICGGVVDDWVHERSVIPPHPTEMAIRCCGLHSSVYLGIYEGRLYE